MFEWPSARTDAEISQYVNQTPPVTEIPRHFIIPFLEEAGFIAMDAYSSPFTLASWGNNSSNFLDWIEACIYEGVILPERVGTDPLPTCVQNNAPLNNLICNGDFEQYDPILNTANNAIPAFIPFYTLNGSSDIVNWWPNGNLLLNPDFFVRNGIGGIPASHSYFTNWKTEVWDFPNPDNKAMAGLYSEYNVNSSLPYYNEEIVTILNAPVLSGRTYVFSGWFKTGKLGDSTDNSASHSLKLILRGQGIANYTAIPAFLLTNHKLVSGNNGWEFVTINFVMPTGSNSYDQLMLRMETPGLTGNNAHSFLDELVLEEVCTVSNWPKQIALQNTSGTLTAGTYTTNTGGSLNVATPLSYTLQEHHYAHRFIDTDSAGNTYLAARVVYEGFGSWLTNFNATIGYGTNPTFNQTIDGPTAILIAKYDDCGQLLWKEHIYNDEVVDLAALQVSQSGEVYVAGNFTNQLASNNVRTSSGCAASSQANRSGNFIVKFDTNGQCLWLEASSAPAPGGLVLTDCELNSAGTELYVAGMNVGSITGNQFTNNVNAGNYFIAQLNNFSTTNPQFPQFIQGSNRSLDRIALSNNSLFVTFFENLTTTPQIVFRKYDPSNLSGGFTASSSPIIDDVNNGNPCWAFPHYVIEDLNVDSQGNLFVVGNFSGSLSFNGTPSSTPSTTVMVQDYARAGIGVTGFVAKYGSNLSFSNYDYLKPSTTLGATISSVVYNSHYYTCDPPTNCDYSSSFFSMFCDTGIRFLCVDFDTVMQYVEEAYTEIAHFSSLYHNIAIDLDDNVLISGLVQNAAWGVNQIDSSNGQMFVCKYNNSLQRAWFNSTEGDVGINNFTYGRTTGIAKHTQDAEFRVTGNFNGSAKLFDNTQLNSPFNTGHIFVTKLIDNGSSSIFKQDTTAANNVFNDTSLWAVYPNPAQNHLQIEPTSKESYTYELRNALGQLVSTKENLSGTHVLNVGGLARGLYLLKVSSGTKSEMIKVILTH